MVSSFYFSSTFALLSGHPHTSTPQRILLRSPPTEPISERATIRDKDLIPPPHCVKIIHIREQWRTLSTTQRGWVSFLTPEKFAKNRVNPRIYLSWSEWLPSNVTFSNVFLIQNQFIKCLSCLLLKGQWPWGMGWLGCYVNLFVLLLFWMPWMLLRCKECSVQLLSQLTLSSVPPPSASVWKFWDSVKYNTYSSKVWFIIFTDRKRKQGMAKSRKGAKSEILRNRE